MVGGLMRAMTDAEVREFLQHGTRTAKLATVGRDGRPHVVPVWFVLDDEHLVITTMSGSAKARHLARDPRVAVSVDDERPPFAFVTVRGTATLHPNPADLLHWTTRIACRYASRDADVDALARRYADIDDLVVRIHIDHVIGRAEVAA
jgi:PPOX class probable F420-dependent enzyme